MDMNMSEPCAVLVAENGMRHGEAAYLLHEWGVDHKLVIFQDRTGSDLDALVCLNIGAAKMIAMMQYPSCVLIEIDANRQGWFVDPSGSLNDAHLGEVRSTTAPSAGEDTPDTMGHLVDLQTGIRYRVCVPSTGLVRQASGGADDAGG